MRDGAHRCGGGRFPSLPYPRRRVVPEVAFESIRGMQGRGPRDLVRPRSRSSTENDFDACQDEIDLRPGQPADPLGEHGPIEGDDLGHVRDRVSRQTSGPRRQGRVSGCVGPGHVRRQWHAHHRPNRAAVERIALDDDDRPSKPGLGAGWRGQVRPPDFALGSHHSVDFRTSWPAASTNPASVASWPTRGRDLSNVAVISSGSCRATYSRRAVL